MESRPKEPKYAKEADIEKYATRIRTMFKELQEEYGYSGHVNSDFAF